MLIKQLIKTGRLLYGISIAAVGVHQLIIKEFRPEILPAFPSLVNKIIFFPTLTGVVLLFSGIIISGIIKINTLFKRKVSLYLGFGFLVLFIFCQLPFILIFNPDKLSGLDTWFGAAEELAYSGGAFVMAGSFSKNNHSERGQNKFNLFLEKLILFGRIFFSALMILFGCSHFVFTDIISTMVPDFFGVPLFWTYFAGAALVAAGIAIILKIWIRSVAFLLAIMLFLFFIFFHIPDAIANPTVGGGNEIIRASVALMFCGIALVIAFTNTNNTKIIERYSFR